jgi:GNAT superfamily N-acetyltransferase
MTRAAEGLEFQEVSLERWPDFERLFQARGAPRWCWCMIWRAAGEEAAQRSGPARKRAMRGRVERGLPTGILAYVDGEPVGWCSIAPRATYRPLGGPPGDDGVWSVVCFFLQRPFRGQGLAKRLLAAAVAHAARRGARMVEAYPVDSDSPSFRFMGQVSMFREAGFEEVARAGSRRHVMRLQMPA